MPIVVNDSRLLWQPTERYVSGTRLAATMRAVGISDTREFHALSVQDHERFWKATLDELGYEWLTPYEDFKDDSAGPAAVRWFRGGRTNVAYNAVCSAGKAELRDQAAIVEVAENGHERSYTYGELSRYASAAAAGLVDLGVNPGDRVALLLPFTADAAAALLAIAALGAVAVPLFSGYGEAAMAERLQDADPRVALVSETITRRGQHLRLRDALAPALATLPAMRIVSVPEPGSDAARGTQHRGDVSWESLVARPDAGDLTVRPVEPNEPVLIAYTSGTTGKPKGIVHAHAGLPLKTTQEMAQIMDIGPGSRVLRITDMGWIGGSYTVLSGLTVGATLIMYAGVPTYPTADRVWREIERHRATHLGLAPTLARMMKAQDAAPTPGQISSLHMTSSVGEAWDEATYRWYCERVGGNRLPVVNHSGGTEVGNLLCAIPSLPIAFGRFNTPVPGIDARVYDEAGHPIRDETGELVVASPFVGLTLGVHHDQARYRSSYWERYPGAWYQGDRATAHADGTWELNGRSDDRLKVAGHGVSPDVVENAAMAVEGVAAAAAVGIPDAITGTRIVLFICAATPEHTEGLSERVRQETAKKLGKALAPAEVHLTPGVPRTPGGKVMRRAARHAYLNPEAGSLGHTDVEGERLDAQSAAAVRAIAAIASPRTN